MKISEGSELPMFNLLTKVNDEILEVKYEDLFVGKTVALFGMPGAFTPTCSRQHLPSIIQSEKDLKKKGAILFVSHDVGAITGLCVRAIWLDHGLIRSEGESVHVCEQYLASLFDQTADTSDPNPVITKLKSSVSSTLLNLL